MLTRLYRFTRWVLGRDPLYPFRTLFYAHTRLRGHQLTIYPDDVFLVSYPRSGNTWMRFLIGNMLNPDVPVTFANVETYIPDIYRHFDKALKRFQKPRLLKSHEYLSPRYPCVIYLVRDPRDVAVSYYHWLRKVSVLPDNFPFSEYIPRFIRGGFDTFGSWGDHTGGWVGARSHRSEFLLVRYEDVQDNPVEVLRGIAEFLAHQTTNAQIMQAIERSSFAQMRLLEQKQADQWVTTQNTREDIAFVRAGLIGQGQQILDPASLAAIEDAWWGPMRQLGYLST